MERKHLTYDSIESRKRRNSQHQSEASPQYYREKRRLSGKDDDVEQARKRHHSSEYKEPSTPSLLPEPPFRLMASSTPLPNNGRGLMQTPPLRSLSFEHYRIPEDFNQSPLMSQSPLSRYGHSSGLRTDSNTSMGDRWDQRRHSATEQHDSFPRTPFDNRSRRHSDIELFKFQTPTPPRFSIDGPRGSRRYSIERTWRQDSSEPSPRYSGETPRDSRYDRPVRFQERRLSDDYYNRGMSNERGFQR